MKVSIIIRGPDFDYGTQVTLYRGDEEADEVVADRVNLLLRDAFTAMIGEHRGAIDNPVIRRIMGLGEG